MSFSARRMHGPSDQKKIKVKWLPEHVVEEMEIHVKSYKSMDIFFNENSLHISERTSNKLRIAAGVESKRRSCEYLFFFLI